MNFSLDSELKKKLYYTCHQGSIYFLFIISYQNSEFLLPDDNNVSLIFLSIQTLHYKKLFDSLAFSFVSYLYNRDIWSTIYSNETKKKYELQVTTPNEKVQTFQSQNDTKLKFCDGHYHSSIFDNASLSPHIKYIVCTFNPKVTHIVVVFQNFSDGHSLCDQQNYF